MPLVALRQLLDHAAEHRYGIPAFNVSNLEQVKAVMAAAGETESPVILQCSTGARRYAGEVYLRHLVLAALEAHPRLPIAVHQDHALTPAACVQAIRSGFSGVMMDGSLLEDEKTPAPFEYNVEVTRRVVDIAHAVGVSVEGELGVLGALEAACGTDAGGAGAARREQLLTDPAQAAAFVERTHVDALAIAIGTSHGAYKFSRRPDGESLALSRVREIHLRIPNTHLVLHGCSSVPQELLEGIREHGGEIPETWGVPLERIQEGILHGVRKVNIDTDIRLAMTGAMRRALAQRRSEIDPRRILREAQVAAKALCKERYEAFGSAGMAPRIRPIPLQDLALRYAEGAFAPVVR